MTANVACGSCGNALREHAKFCDECGTSAAPSPSRPKYKQVTVLFADVVRSMELAAAVDMERLRDIMSELLERSASVVRRYGGAVEYTGDGVMGLFGAPIAMEDHALRACLAAVAIQEAAGRLAVDVAGRDGMDLRVRVGLNSGRVIAGELGTGSSRFSAIGETVGFAQRMESAAPPGGVLLSESTARLVERTAKLAEPNYVRIKGFDDPVPARQLLTIGRHDGDAGRAEAGLVGRAWEMAALCALLDRTIDGCGSVANVVGPPGIGKSRVAREAAAMATDRGVEVVWAFCESHTRDLPFYAVSRLLRAGIGADGLADDVARAQAQAAVPADADPQDVLLLNDLLGIADPSVASPQIDPDARRRRLTALLSTAALARSDPALLIIEDAHWIDDVSQSIIAEVLAVIPQTRLMVLVTSRPEYQGALVRAHHAHTIALAALRDSDTAELLGEMLGGDDSIGEVTTLIAERAAGNPFFAEEMVRELVERGVLSGERGAYTCDADVAELTVPATVQAAIEARIDRLDAPARRTLDAASVIGARFTADLLGALDIDVVTDALLGAELIERVSVTPRAEFAFRHPLIRAVAYEAQLKTDRAEWHRRIAAAIEAREPAAVDENAALIAAHLESAGELHAAYGWHMRAAGWSASRNVGASRLSWERAIRIANSLPDDDPARLTMRIPPRAMLCATDWQARTADEGRGRFMELRELCSVADDKVSLAIGMSGWATELLYAARPEGARLASEQTVILDSIGDPNLTAGLAFIAFANWFSVGEIDEILRWSQVVIDIADGDPTLGAGFGIGSPLAVAVALRGLARCWLGLPGWRRDFDAAVTMARNSDPATLSIVVVWTYGQAIVCEAVQADDSVMDIIDESLTTARQTSSDIGLIFAEFTLGGALLWRDVDADRSRGVKLVIQSLEWQRERMPSLVPITSLFVAREKARSGELDGAISEMRWAVDELHRAGRLGYAVFGAVILVESLLKRGRRADLTEAAEVIDRLAGLRPDQALAMRDIWLLRMRTLLAKARGDDEAYRNLARNYRGQAESLGFDGHIAVAKAMVE